MENYVSKFSTNPLIREGVLDISENYYKTYGSMWMFHDIMEMVILFFKIFLKMFIVILKLSE